MNLMKKFVIPLFGLICFGRIFDEAPAKTLGFKSAYHEIAESRKVHFLDAANIAEPPASEDGVHIDEQSARALGEAIASLIENKIF